MRVLDPSALVHALPVLKRWIREDKYKLVVPLSGQSFPLGFDVPVNVR